MRSVHPRYGPLRLASRIARGLERLIDDASIGTKVLVAPALAILALALVFGTSIHGLRAEEDVNAQVMAVQQEWIAPLAEARTLTLQLQANLFRITAFRLVGAEPRRLDAIADSIEADDARLQALLRDPPGAQAAPATRRALLAAYGEYRRQSFNAVTNLLQNPGWGATTARNAATTLDGVIADIDALRDVGLRAIAVEIDGRVRLHDRVKRNLMWVMALGSFVVMLANTLVGWRISAPVQRLTVAMQRIANREFEHVIPATQQRDEVGSMARAVEVFKEGMIRADASTAEKQATQVFLNTVLENLPMPLVVKRAEGLRYVLMNPAFEELMGTTRAEIIGKTSFDVMTTRDADAIFAHDTAALESGGLTVAHDFVLFAGTPRQRLTTVTRIVVADANRQPQYLISVVEDITERRKVERRLARMAEYDSLTDLPNRTLFAERLALALKRRSPGDADAAQIAVLCLDLDRFKEVNDTLGHAAGDAVLRVISARLRRCIRSADTLARLGGDEFAVVQHLVKSPGDAEMLSNRLLDCVKDPVEFDGQMLFVGLSIGIALGDPTIPASELMQRADLALYHSKESGRGCFKFFLPPMAAHVNLRRTLELDLRAAVDAGELILDYQPSVSLRTGAIIGTEALIHWTHPTHGAVPSSIFIPLAEETGLIAPIGLWQMEEACREAASWQLPIRIAINVSPVHFRKPGFAGQVKGALARSGLDPARLELEISERVLISNTAETLTILAELRAVGARVVLDDFGTDYASLANLQTFAFDKIKIVRSFVKNMETDSTVLAILRAVLGLTDSLNMSSSADGVELATQADLLRTLCCSEAQGDFFWRPMSAAALQALLRRPAMLEEPTGATG
jgi:diguanylate cyclase (GGDEF)-like protein/PAS domain S-box-containing protein